MSNDLSKITEEVETAIIENVISRVFLKYPRNLLTPQQFYNLLTDNTEVTEEMYNSLEFQEGVINPSKESLGWLVAGEFEQLATLVDRCIRLYNICS